MPKPTLQAKPAMAAHPCGREKCQEGNGGYQKFNAYCVKTHRCERNVLLLGTALLGVPMVAVFAVPTVFIAVVATVLPVSTLVH